MSGRFKTRILGDLRWVFKIRFAFHTTFNAIADALGLDFGFQIGTKIIPHRFEMCFKKVVKGL